MPTRFRQPNEKGFRSVPSLDIGSFLLIGGTGNVVNNAYQHWIKKQHAKIILPRPVKDHDRDGLLWDFASLFMILGYDADSVAQI